MKQERYSYLQEEGWKLVDGWDAYTGEKAISRPQLIAKIICWREDFMMALDLEK